MEHIKLNKLGSNADQIEFLYDFNGIDLLVVVDVEYWTIKKDSYGVSGSSWTEVDPENFEFSHCVMNEDGDYLPSNFLCDDEIVFIEQECINYLNDEYV